MDELFSKKRITLRKRKSSRNWEHVWEILKYIMGLDEWGTRIIPKPRGLFVIPKPMVGV